MKLNYLPDECFIVLTVEEQSKNSVVNMLKQKGYVHIY